MKKLINRPEQVVAEMLEGLVAIYPHVSLLADHNVVLRAEAEELRERQVAVISGGGSGHEPAHAGYVGAGMLSAAVAGEVFTSPNPESVLAAIHAVAGSPGVLLIVKNYTGDRLNFGLAAEIARSQQIPVEMVVVGDDIALCGAGQHAGPRGIAGTVFVHKIAGAAAAQGRSLWEVAAIAQATAKAIASMGVSLSAGTVPAVGKPSYALGEEEIELGLGIHGEPGVRRIALTPADGIADQLVESIVSVQKLVAGERIAVMVNNLGATTLMELAIFARRALHLLASRHLAVERVYAGTFMSSLEAAGVSLSLLRLDDQRLAYLDAPTTAPAWLNARDQRMRPVESRIISSSPGPVADLSLSRPIANNGLRKAIESVCEALLQAEARLTELDRIAGDGDLGTNLARGAGAVQAALPGFPFTIPSQTLRAVALTFQRAVGGSSGPLYGGFLLRAAQSLEGADGKDPRAWARAAVEGCQALCDLGGASQGDRTMLDALLPFARTFSTALDHGRSRTDALETAVSAAEAGAAATAAMIPRRGRSSYLGERALGHPDAGAIAAATWLRALVSAI